MILSVIVAGVETVISHGDPTWLLEWDGLGMAELHRLSERGPLQHGDSDRGYRFDPRFVSLALGALAITPAGLWTLRRQILGIFRPGSQPIILKATLENGDMRQLDCHYFGGMNMPSQDRRLRVHQKVGVILKASDPSWYDPVAHSVTFSLGGGAGAGFTVPMEVPHEVGGAGLSASGSIVYDGDWPFGYPHLIRITGPVTDCVITNLSTNEKLDFTGTTIAAADHYDVDLRFGYKTILDAAGANKIATLTGDSDLATWHLAPDPDVPGGVNSISVAGSGVNADTNVQISYYDRYLGI